MQCSNSDTFGKVAVHVPTFLQSILIYSTYGKMAASGEGKELNLVVF